MADRIGDWWRGISAAWHYGRGKGAYKHGRYAEAAKRFRRSHELAPHSSDAQEWVVKSERAASAGKR